MSPSTPIKKHGYAHYTASATAAANCTNTDNNRTPSIADLAIAFLANGTHTIAFHHRRLALHPLVILAMVVVVFVMRLAICWLTVQNQTVAIGPTGILAGKWWVMGYVSNLRNSLGDISRLTVPRLSLESFLVDTLFHHGGDGDQSSRLLSIRRAVKSAYGGVILLSITLIIVAWVKTRHMRTMHRQLDPDVVIPLWTVILMVPMDPTLALCIVSPSRSLHFFAYITYLLSGVSILVSVVGGGGVKLTAVFTLFHSIPYILAIWQLTAFNKQKMVVVHDLI